MSNKVHSAHKLLLKLHVLGFTGKVTIRKEKLERSVFFSNGEPLYTESNIRSETLGQLLLKEGKITDDQYLSVLIQMQAEGGRQGEIVMRFGYLSPFEVFDVLTEQSIQNLQSCIALADVEVTIEKGEEHVAGVPVLPLQFRRLLMEFNQTQEAEGKELFEPPQGYLALNEKGQQYVSRQSFQPLELRVVELLDGTREFDQVVAAAEGSRSEIGCFMTILSVGEGLGTFTSPGLQVTGNLPLAGSEGWEIPDANAPEPPAKKQEEDSTDLSTWMKRIDTMYHELLGVGFNLTSGEVRSRFEAIVEKLHLNDLDEHYGEKERRDAEILLDRLMLANTVLSDPKRKAKYVEDLLSQKTSGEVPRYVRAEVCIQKARLQLEKKQYQRALKEMRKAIEIEPKEAAYRVELAACLLRKAIEDRKKIMTLVERELREALRLNPSSFDACFQLGKVAKMKNDLELARTCFQRAVDLKPNFPRAVQELRSVSDPAAGKAKGQGKFLGRLKK